MEKLTAITATACPIDIVNLNTDQLIPVRFLKLPRAAGYGKFLLHDLRYDALGHERPDFPLNRAAWREARILVGERNFACGSSREGAVYALMDWGIRCVIAPSFGDIFAGNAVQNGLLTAAVRDEEARALMAALWARPSAPVTVDLDAQTIALGGETISFAIDPVRRLRLLNGWEDIDMTRSHASAIASFKAADRMRRPWAIPPATPVADPRS
ncbi:MAG TPA: 3-isopropylmalate dehydratase small subunit [Xanthobacteraceae bacterium]|jgi:3-isopropylmalate/(R)-2-methylmalate dehydratase small subunit